MRIMRRLIALSAFTILALVHVASAHYVLGAGLYDDAAPVFIYTGNWFDDLTPSHYLGSAHYTSIGDGGGTIEFSIYGDSFTLFITRSPLGGDALVCIDAICSTLSFYAPDQEFQVAIGYSGLAAGIHDIEISAVSGEMVFDALLVEPITMPTATATSIPSETPTATFTPEFTETPTATPTALPFIEYQVTDGMGAAQTVRYSYSTDTGQITIIQFLAGIFFLGIIFLIFQIWRYFDGSK
jgi:hypothetical protein